MKWDHMNQTGRVRTSVRDFLRDLWRDESGVAMLETVLIFPLQLLFTMLIIQVAMVFVGANVVNYAAYQAARTALVTMRGDSIEAETRLAADRAAWVVCTSLHNATTAENRHLRQKMRLFQYNYFFPRDMSKRLEGELTLFTVEGHPEESLIEYEARYWMPLAVPLGAQTLGVIMPSGDGPGTVKKIDGFHALCLQQRSAVTKVWPY